MPERSELLRPLKACLHVTAQEHLPSILDRGLELRVGPLSKCLEEPPAVWLFPHWECLEDAQWLWDAWPYESEPVLLAVNTEGLELMRDADYEVASYAPIEPWRIQVLADTQFGWRKEDFVALGGLQSAKAQESA